MVVRQGGCSYMEFLIVLRDPAGVVVNLLSVCQRSFSLSGDHFAAAAGVQQCVADGLGVARTSQPKCDILPLLMT